MSGTELTHTPLPHASRRRRRHGGFTLIELMITVAIIGILVKVALPAYMSYVTRTNVQQALQALSAGRVKMEQYYMDNRSYSSDNGTTCGTGFDTGSVTGTTLGSSTAGKFTLSCTLYTTAATAYKITAQGTGSMSNFTYTISGGAVGTTSYDNLMTSTINQAGWPASCTSSWASRPGSC